MEIEKEEVIMDGFSLLCLVDKSDDYGTDKRLSIYYKGKEVPYSDITIVAKPCCEK